MVTSWHTDVVGGSGTAVFLNTLVEGLRGRGYHIELIAPELHGDDYIDVTLQRFLFNARLPYDARVQAADVLIGFDYDGYALDPAHRPPMIQSLHAVYADVLQWETDPARTMVQAQAFFDRVAVQQADINLIGSEYARQRVVKLYGADPDSVVALPHGLPPAPWLQLVDSQPRSENDHPVLLAVGKLYPRKRIDILLHAVGLLRHIYADIELRIVGTGLEWRRLQQLMNELNLEQHVTWLGHITDDAAFAHEWRQADIFCHPSIQETFGYVYVEAMSIGKPIVAADAGAAPEVLGDAALLVEPGSAEAFAVGVEGLLLDTERRNDLSFRARERAPQFTIERMLDGYQAAIESLTKPA